MYYNIVFLCKTDTVLYNMPSYKSPKIENLMSCN